MALRATSNMADDEDEVIPPSDCSEDENYISETSNNNIGDYDPPSFPSDIDSEEVNAMTIVKMYMEILEMTGQIHTDYFKHQL